MYFTGNCVTAHEIWQGVKFSLANFPECVWYIITCQNWDRPCGQISSNSKKQIMTNFVFKFRFRLGTYHNSAHTVLKNVWNSPSWLVPGVVSFHLNQGTNSTQFFAINPLQLLTVGLLICSTGLKMTRGMPNIICFLKITRLW